MKNLSQADNVMTDNYNLCVVMDALLADSPTVPGLLTEYILRGECKAASDVYTSGSDVCNLPLVIGRGGKNI